MPQLRTTHSVRLGQPAEYSLLLRRQMHGDLSQLFIHASPGQKKA